MGTKDGIVNPLKFEAAKENDPKDTAYLQIKEANNTGFADTTLIKDDNQSGISFDEQTDQTAEMINQFATETITKAMKKAK